MNISLAIPHELSAQALGILDQHKQNIAKTRKTSTRLLHLLTRTRRSRLTGGCDHMHACEAESFGRLRQNRCAGGHYCSMKREMSKCFAGTKKSALCSNWVKRNAHTRADGDGAKSLDIQTVAIIASHSCA